MTSSWNSKIVQVLVEVNWWNSVIRCDQYVYFNVINVN